jgi:hypothetical protein
MTIQMTQTYGGTTNADLTAFDDELGGRLPRLLSVSDGSSACRRGTSTTWGPFVAPWPDVFPMSSFR